MILNTTWKAGESSLISSGFNSNRWQKLSLEKNFTLRTKFHTGKTILENLGYRAPSGVSRVQAM